MEKINPILRYLLLTCNLICITLAVVYTYLQIKIYFENEDVSSISFRKFENGNEEKYPTYTICFEDSSILQIYKTEPVLTGCRIYDGCPEEGEPIWYAKPESNMIRLWKEKFSQNLDSRKRRSPESIQNDTNLDQANHMSELKEVKLRLRTLRKKRGMPVFQEIEGIHYLDDSAYGSGDDVIFLKTGEETFVISPKQYQQLMMGINETLDYSYEKALWEKEIVNDFNYDVGDLWKFNFNSTIIELKEFLLRHELKTVGSIIHGWHADEYQTLESYCQARTFPAFNDGVRDCNVEDTFLQNLEKMQNSEYPFEKTYQDPLKVCYSPMRDESRSIKTEQITMDLKEMFYDYDRDMFRFGSPLPFMTIYVHQKGQFIENIGNPVASFSPQDVTAHCKHTTMDINGELTVDEEGCSGTKIEIDISQVTILNSRHDAQVPCNESLKNEDSKTMEYIMEEKLGCSPMFWKGFESAKLVEGCTELEKYKLLRNITTEFNNFNDIQNEFHPPCDTMYIETNMKRGIGRDLQSKVFDYGFDEEGFEFPNKTKTGLYLDLIFYIAPDNFQNIVNHRGFTVENCWAGIGGFIGIFVGVSLMQIPELLIEFFFFLKKSY